MLANAQRTGGMSFLEVWTGQVRTTTRLTGALATGSAQKIEDAAAMGIMGMSAPRDVSESLTGARTNRQSI
jgi:hypothetical protein